MNERPTPLETPDKELLGPYVYASFWGLVATQFLGAFNDNLYKQILLLLFVQVPLNGQTRDLQWLATAAFSIPFVLFSGYAGYLSDRYSKRNVIILSKVAEIVIMAAGAAVFFLVMKIGLTLPVICLLCITIFCMGAQSAFFGPGKYGILPEFLPERCLPGANGFMLMTTFFAIIFGSALAGTLLEFFRAQLWLAGLVCTVIAILGTATSFMVARVDPAQSSLRFEWSTVAIPRALRDYFREDRALWGAVVVSSVFWMAASLAQMAVNALGKLQLDVGDQRTSLMVASISVGIAVGSLVAGALSRQRFNTGVLLTGLWGMCACLLLLGIPTTQGNHHLLGYGGSIAALVVLGGFTGMFAVPLQVFLQARPPQTLKGRMIATQNLCNWIGIVASAPLYGVVSRVLVAIDWPPSTMFLLIMSILAMVGIYLHAGWRYCQT